MNLTDAQIAKLAAEEAEIRARIARAEKQDAIAEKRAAARLEQQELALRKQAAETKMSELDAAKAERDEKTMLSEWRYSYTLNFIGSVQKDTALSAMDRLHQFDVMDPTCDITIVFNSPGGSVIDGLALFDYIRFIRDKGHKVTIVALGYAASMAGILLQAADVRVMAKGSWLLIHEVAFGTQGKIGEVEDMYEFGKRLKEQAAQIFIDRSDGKLTRDHLEKNWARKDWWLNAEEAMSLGLIDEIR